MADMTGVNGQFWLVGREADNPSARDVMRNASMMWTSTNGPNTGLWVFAHEASLDPFDRTATVTHYIYEFNGLTDEDGENFLQYYHNMAGDNGELSGSFFQELFNLPTEPLVGVNGAPKWGEDPTGLPPTLVIYADEYDDWARRGRESRRLIREAEELDAQNRAQEARMLAEMAAARAQPAPAPAGPRTRARAAREEREQLDEF